MVLEICCFYCFELLGIEEVDFNVEEIDLEEQVWLLFEGMAIIINPENADIIELNSIIIKTNDEGLRVEFLINYFRTRYGWHRNAKKITLMSLQRWCLLYCLTRWCLKMLIWLAHLYLIFVLQGLIECNFELVHSDLKKLDILKWLQMNEHLHCWSQSHMFIYL